MSGHMELRHLMSNSMSEKDHELNLRGTEFDSNTPELYATIPDAQKEHTRYNASQVRNVEGSVSGSLPSAESRYGHDDITGEGSLRGGCASGKEEVGSGGGVVRGGAQRMETKNMMYEESEIKAEYQHPSLARGDRQVYAGPVADDYREPKDSYVTCRFKTKDLLLAFFIIVAILLAVASLALSLLLWFGLNGGSDCTCPDEGTYDTLALELDYLEQTNQDMQLQLNRLQSTSATHSDLTGGVSSIQTAISQLNNTLLTLQNRDGSTLTLNNISIHDSCIPTVVSTSCSLYLSREEGEEERDIICATVSPVPTDEPGTFLQRAYCRIGNAAGENNTLSTTLVIDDEQEMVCRCSKTIPGEDLGQVDHDINCEIVVTRCPLQQNINGILTLG